jgi:hypothetical protein
LGYEGVDDDRGRTPCGVGENVGTDSVQRGFEDAPPSATRRENLDVGSLLCKMVAEENTSG